LTGRRRKRRQQLIEADGKSHQVKAAEINPGQPLIKGAVQELDNAVKVKSAQMPVLPAMLVKKPGGLFSSPREEQWTEQGLGGPAILRQMMIGFGAQRPCDLEIRMKGMGLEGPIPIQPGLQRPELDGRPVEDGPGHGDQGHPEGIARRRH